MKFTYEVGLLMDLKFRHYYKYSKSFNNKSGFIIVL